MKGLGLPGGIIKADEDVETALKREVLEETGLRVTKLTYLWSINSHKIISMLCLFFEVEADGILEDFRRRFSLVDRSQGCNRKYGLWRCGNSNY